MPYVIINDKDHPWRYYVGQGFHNEDTTVEPSGAKVFESLPDVSTIMRGRSDLYALGWRYVSVPRV